MFGRVWRWAGAYRTTDKNLGVERAVILPRLYEAFEQTAFWVEHKTFGPDEIGTRFHHALVQVHPFPNGNGRWSRLMADVLVVRIGRPRFFVGLQLAARRRRRAPRLHRSAASRGRSRFPAYIGIHAVIGPGAD